MEQDFEERDFEERVLPLPDCDEWDGETDWAEWEEAERANLEAESHEWNQMYDP